MWFRNVQLYRLPEQWDMTTDRLSEQLSRLVFKPCGSQDTQSMGWTPPVADGLVHGVAGQWLIALGVERRLLPPAVVAKEVEQRARTIEEDKGFKPGRKLMREIKEAVTQELMPRAFTKFHKVYAWIDPKAGWLAIDAPSRSAAEPLIEAVHKAVEELPLKLVNPEFSPGSAMTFWLAGGEAPGAFTIDEDCELRAVTDEASAVRYVHHSLEGEEIRGHIAAGKQVSKLALSFDDRVSFVLTDKFEIKRVRPLDILIEKASEGDAKTQEEQFDADFALMAGELGRLIPALLDALGGEVTTI
jgi:recombination associated protein RdgC